MAHLHRRPACGPAKLSLSANGTALAPLEFATAVATVHLSASADQSSLLQLLKNSNIIE